MIVSKSSRGRVPKLFTDAVDGGFGADEKFPIHGHGRGHDAVRQGVLGELFKGAPGFYHGGLAFFVAEKELAVSMEDGSAGISLAAFVPKQRAIFEIDGC